MFCIVAFKHCPESDGLMVLVFPPTEFIMRTPTPHPRLRTTTEAPRGGVPGPQSPRTPAGDRTGPGTGAEERGQRRKKKKPPSNGAVRLMRQGRRGRGRGRVEIFIDGEWGTVCDDGWSRPAAAVVCRQLGFPYVVRATKKAEFGEGTSLRILLDDVQCSGQEGTLLECSHAGVGTHNCSHEEDAGVVCSREEGAGG